MRPLRYLLRFFMFAAVFAAGLWTFAPWDECGLLAFEELRAAAAGSGYYVTCGSIRRDGLFPPRYIFSDMDVEGPMVKVTFKEASAELKPLRSALSLKAAFHMDFDGASVRYIPKNGFEMSRGEMYVETDGREIALKRISVEGDLKMTGGVTLGLADKSVIESDAVMTVPPDINMILNTSMMARYVESVSPGEWRIKANAAQRK
jgi:hypothetical protein